MHSAKRVRVSKQPLYTNGGPHDELAAVGFDELHIIHYISFIYLFIYSFIYLFMQAVATQPVVQVTRTTKPAAPSHDFCSTCGKPVKSLFCGNCSAASAAASK